MNLCCTSHNYFVLTYVTHVSIHILTGQEAPNPNLFDVSSEKWVPLLSFQCGNRPLVLNFGSGSWVRHTDSLEKFLPLVEKYSDDVDFLMIYIDEVHLEEQIKNNSHATMEEKVAAARVHLKVCVCVSVCVLNYRRKNNTHFMLE